MKKKMMSFLASPIYHARSLPQTHRTKVQFLIVRLFLRTLVRSRYCRLFDRCRALFIHIISRVLIVHFYGTPSY